MDRIHHRDKQQEGTAKPTGKSGPKSWEVDKYIYNEPRDDKGSSHCDPRLELALQSHGQHQDSDSIPYDGDHGYIHPAFGVGATPKFNDSASSTSDLGTLAGGAGLSIFEGGSQRHLAGDRGCISAHQFVAEPAQEHALRLRQGRKSAPQ